MGDPTRCRGGLHVRLPPWDGGAPPLLPQRARPRRSCSRASSSSSPVLAGARPARRRAGARRADRPHAARRPATPAAARSRTRSPTPRPTRTTSCARAAQGRSPRPLRALAGRRGRDRGAGRALAPAGRARGARGERRPGHARGARVPRERGPRGRDGGRHRGRRRADPDPGRDRGRTCSGCDVDVRGEPAADAADRARGRSRAATTAPRRSADERQAVDERYDPVKALAGTARYLTIAQRRSSAARTSRSSATTWASGTCRACSPPTATRTPPTPGSTSTRRPTATPTSSAGSRRSATTPRPISGGSGAAREIMRLYRDDPAELAAAARRCRPRRTRPRRSCTRSTTRRRSPTRRSCARRTTTATIHAFPNDPAVTGLARDGRMGELAERRRRPSRRCTAGCGPRRSRWRCTSAPRCATTAAGRRR